MEVDYLFDLEQPPLIHSHCVYISIYRGAGEEEVVGKHIPVLCMRRCSEDEMHSTTQQPLSILVGSKLNPTPFSRMPVFSDRDPLWILCVV